jgi:hypothetical protein
MNPPRHHCFEISFPGVDFDAYLTQSENVKPVHHAHLFPNGDAIEIRIYFEQNTYFGDKLSRWAYETDWDTFGKTILAEIEEESERLQRLDFTHSKLRGIQSTMGARFIVLSIDSFQGYWPVNKELAGTGEFYLSDSGFHVVKHFYAPLWGIDGEYQISRMDGMDRFYGIGVSKFRPEFFLRPMGNVEDREERIIKEPKIQFQYPIDVSLEEALNQAEIVRNLISFHSHTTIDYVTSKVYLRESTVITRKVVQQTISKPSGHLWGFGNDMQLHQFLDNDWQHLLLQENFKKLEKLMELFLQSLLVDGSSKFLLYWTMLEICSKTKPEDEQFRSHLSKKEKGKKFKEAFQVLSEIVGDEDRTEFEKRWNDTLKLLMNKPMAGAFLKYFIKEGLDPSSWPISLKDLKDMRNNIVHGSTSEVSSKELRRANVFLYRVAGILILKHLGIQEWELDLSLR